MNNSAIHICTEPEEEYHARSRSGEYLSSHMLAKFREMPYKYWATIAGKIVEPDRSEYIIGRASHKLILEGQDAFNEEYIVSDGPINERTGKNYGRDTKAYQEWLAEQTGQVITTAEFEEIRLMREAIESHKEIKEKFLSFPGVPEAVVRSELEGIKCQIRMDLFISDVGIIDLKTCRDITFFDYDIRSFGYAFQLAFYQDVLERYTGKKLPVYIIAIDKTPLHVAGYWKLPDSELEFASRINIAAIRRLKECRQTGKWPTGFERMQIFNFNK